MIALTIPFDTTKVYVIAAFRDAIAGAIPQIPELLNDEDGSFRPASAILICQLAGKSK